MKVRRRRIQILKCPQLSIVANVLQSVFEKGFHRNLTSQERTLVLEEHMNTTKRLVNMAGEIFPALRISLAINSCSFVRTLLNTLKLISNVICLLNFIFLILNSNLNPSFCLSYRSVPGPINLSMFHFLVQWNFLSVSLLCIHSHSGTPNTLLT